MPEGWQVQGTVQGKKTQERENREQGKKRTLITVSSPSVMVFMTFLLFCGLCG